MPCTPSLRGERGSAQEVGIGETTGPSETKGPVSDDATPREPIEPLTIDDVRELLERLNPFS